MLSCYYTRKRELPVIILGIRYKKASTVVSRYSNVCSFTCVCVYVFISVHACGASPSQSHLVLDFSICFSAGERPGVEGEEITQHAQAEFSRTKTIWVKVTQWNSVGSAALSHHPATMLWCTWVEASSFFSQKRNQRRKREGGREGGIYLKALNFFFFFLSLGHVHRWFISRISE